MTRTITGWFEARRIRRQFRTTRRWPIGEIPEDTLGTLRGRVDVFEDGWLEAPLSGRRCVYYSVVVDEHLGMYGRGALTTIARFTDSVPFVIAEDGSRAVIDLAQAVVSAALDVEETCSPADGATARQRALLDHIRTDWFRSTVLTLREGVLELGEEVHLLGTGVREPDPDRPPASAYRGDAPTRLRLGGATLIVTDDLESI